MRVIGAALALAALVALASAGTCNLPQTNRIDCWPSGSVNQTQCQVSDAVCVLVCARLSRLMLCWFAQNKGCCWSPVENGIPWYECWLLR